MALLVELAPCLKISFIDGDSSRHVELRSGDVNNILKKYMEDYTVYLAAGGNIGSEIVNVLKQNGSNVKHIKIKDNAKISAYIKKDNFIIGASEKMHKLTFEDVMSIKNEFVQNLYNEDTVLIPVFDIEKEFVLEFLRKIREYHKNSVVFGDAVINTLVENPSIAIITEDQIIDYAPFKIVNEYELINFSYSLNDGRETMVIVLTKSGILFYSNDECIQFSIDSYNVDMIMFACLFSLENKLPVGEWAKFISSASQSRPGVKIGDIMQISKRINLSVLHR